MEKDFDAWNEQKKKIEISVLKPRYFPREGEVWMCFVGKNIGLEQNGGGGNFSRPMLIIKKFNNQMFWAVPLSTKQKEFYFYYNFSDPTGREVSAVLAQLKLVSFKRLNRKFYTMPKNNMSEIKELLKSFLV